MVLPNRKLARFLVLFIPTLIVLRRRSVVPSALPENLASEISSTMGG
jgi:hypothetical protein